MSTVKTEKRTDPFKPVIRKKDMDRDMYNDIERMAKECVENPKEKFKDENILDDENEYNAAQRNLLFDDETLSVSYQLHNETIFSRVCDTLPVFIIIASCAFIIVFIVSVAIYFKKKKSLN